MTLHVTVYVCCVTSSRLTISIFDRWPLPRSDHRGAGTRPGARTTGSGAPRVAPQTGTWHRADRTLVRTKPRSCSRTGVGHCGSAPIELSRNDACSAKARRETAASGPITSKA